MKRSILTTGLVGTTSAGTTAVALAKVGAPRQAVVLAVIAMVLAVIALVLAVIADPLMDLISLLMTLGVVYRLIEQRCPGSFKGPRDVVFNGSPIVAGPEPQPLKSKPPPDS